MLAHCREWLSLHHLRSETDSFLLTIYAWRQAAGVLDLWKSTGLNRTLVQKCKAQALDSLAMGSIEAEEHQQQYESAVARMFGQRWLVKKRIRRAKAKAEEKIPFHLGPGSTIGRSSAVSCAKMWGDAVGGEMDLAEVSAVKEVRTMVKAVTTCCILSINNPQHVIAVSRAMAEDATWKADRLLTFEGLRRCSHRNVEKLARRIRRERLQPGEILFEVGEAATELIFVLSGALTIIEEGRDADDTAGRQWTVGPGATFGSFPQALSVRHATVVASVESEILSAHMLNVEAAFARDHYARVADYCTLTVGTGTGDALPGGSPKRNIVPATPKNITSTAAASNEQHAVVTGRTPRPPSTERAARDTAASDPQTTTDRLPPASSRRRTRAGHASTDRTSNTPRLPPIGTRG